jgi:putative phosphoesterase
MRVAFLSDAHGNAVSTGRCLQAVSDLGVHAIYFLGDVVGYLPGERESLQLLRDAGAHCQSGNHEAMILGRLAAARGNEPQYQHGPAVARLGAERLEELRGWPDRRQIDIDGHRVLLVHGDPTDPLEGACYPDADMDRYGALPYDVVVMGHTHRPFVATTGPTTLINAGSCGLPRDQGDAPAFAVFDSDTGLGTIHRVRVAPADVLNAYSKHTIHDAVRSCLHRTAPTVVGEFVRAH